ncbi:MAG: hypothetical protein ACXABD_21870 [Candidatus Thorarchaeota archaeon]
MRTDQAKIALDFIKELELASGGIRGWGGAPAYPEVSGYLIPTLLDYGESDMATRIADWLVSIQNDDGSYGDMYNQKRTFDTAAVMEGLTQRGYFEPALKARQWLGGQVRDDGAMRMTPESDETHLYTMRVSALIGSHSGKRYWMTQEWKDTREHYVAYALEGLWKMGEEEFVKEKLQERDWSSEDLCANAQFAILHHQAGLDATPFVNLVENKSWNISNSWTAKWILDMWRVVGEA